MLHMEMEREQQRWHIAEALTDQFIQRPDVYAIQLPDGRYASVKKVFTPSIMYLHLLGELTIGAYLLDSSSHTRQLVLDADDMDQFHQIANMAAGLQAAGIPTYLETSRRGGHLRFFFSESIPGQKARRFGKKLLADYGLSIEMYPKQDMARDGPGSLVRVPFGKHRLTGRRYGFIYPDGRDLAPLKEQVRILANPETVPLEFVEENQYEMEVKPIHPRIGNGETVWDRIKSSITVYEFVSHYVELTRIGSGYLGKCPFHEDRIPSFGVNEKGNYWNCFAGCGGGSVIDFWMTRQGVVFKTAVSELEEMLLKGA